MLPRSNTLAIITIGLVAELGIYAFLRQAMDLSPRATLPIVGVLLWSVCTIIVSERIGDRWLSLRDYSALDGFGVGTLVVIASQTASALSPTGPAAGILVWGLVVLPVAAVSGLIRRVQFSPEEREAIRKMRRRGEPAVQALNTPP